MIKISALSQKIQGVRQEELAPELRRFLDAASRVLVEKESSLRLSWCCIMAGGHLLIEDVPGVGKTTMVKLIAKLLNLPWKRIQCTSDILPADITGGSVFDQKSGEFSFIKGPIFANLVMADELNRASPKSQSAFLQAMEEGAVTVDGTMHALPSPFIVVATQNPMDSAGTNPLPESQLDRFMMAISLGFPARSGERKLLTEPSRADLIEATSPLFDLAELSKLRMQINSIYVGDAVADYILNLAEWIRARAEGCSPRSLLALTACAKAWSFGCQRDFIQPSDVQAVAPFVLGHRLTPKNVGLSESGSDIVAAALRSVQVDS